jgi:hypothetical protein
MRGHVQAFLLRRLNFWRSLLPSIRSKSSWAIAGDIWTPDSLAKQGLNHLIVQPFARHTCLVKFSPWGFRCPLGWREVVGKKCRHRQSWLLLSMQQNYWASMEPLGQCFAIPLYFSRPLKKPLLFLLREARCSSPDIHWLHFVHFFGVIFDREVDQSSWVLLYSRAAKSWALNTGCSSLKAPR